MRSKVGFFVLFCCSLFSAEDVYLKAPDLSEANIITTKAGIRPCRKSGVRLEAEVLQNKLIVHNYGYGGSGLTLCLGGAKEVTDILSSFNHPSRTVAVLGAGVAGLSSAYDLLEQGYEVHIYSDEWSPNLTSNVAIGIWSPLVLAEDAPEEKKVLNQRILETSEKRFLKSTTDHPEFAGVRFIDSYSFKSNASEGAIKTKHRGEEVVVHFDNGIVKNGRKIQEIGIDGKVFVEDLFSKVKAKGASLIQHHFKDLSDVLSLPEEIIINCTSMGSQEIFNDEEFIPVRGQIVYFLPQEGVNFLLYQNVPNSTSSWVSIFPWSDRIIVGGVYEKGQKDPVITPEVIDAIIENAKKSLSGEF